MSQAVLRFLWWNNCYSNQCVINQNYRQAGTTELSCRKPACTETSCESCRTQDTKWNEHSAHGGLFKDTLAMCLLFISTPHFVICSLEHSPRCLKNFVIILRICHTCYMHCPSQHVWQHDRRNIRRCVHTKTVLAGNFSTDSCWEILYVGVRFLLSTLLTAANLVI
jgi:hypothetical protein